MKGLWPPLAVAPWWASATWNGAAGRIGDNWRDAK